MGDIKEMFLRIKIREEDQGAQRFLRRGMDRKRDPDVYVMTSMLFRATSSPCTAQYIMNKNAKDFKKKYPRATKAIKNKHYVDDYLDSADSLSGALSIIKEVTEIQKHGGFEITGWISNNKTLQSKLSADIKDNGLIDLTKEHIVRALGINWNASKDTITFNFNSKKIPDSIVNKNENPTKRKMLSVIMSIYDPLGILLLLSIRSKILLQDVWRRRSTWDEKLTQEEFTRWQLWVSELKKAKDYQIPRAYFNQGGVPREIELHVFSDASDKAYSAVAYVNENITQVLPDISHFSKWLCLIRSTASILMSPRRWQGDKSAILTLDLLRKAELLWIRKVQQECFGLEFQRLKGCEQLDKSSRLKDLSPTINEDEVMRIDGRIREATDVPHDVKFPVILDGKHRYTRLMVQYYHEKFGHSSPETIVNELRQKYWIIKLRPTVRSVSSQCQWCRVQKAKPQVPRMGDLPIERLGHDRRPFTFCGIDYFCPMLVTVGRRNEKRWGVLITCLTTRAIHLEIASSMSTNSAIMALRRMIARRGSPSEIFSDNGTNLRGMDLELQKAIKEIDYSAIEKETTSRGIKWRYIPPATPHMGGSWERLVRSVKVALAVTLKSRAPKEEVLSTLLAEAENVVNSRPLTHVSVDHREMESLTHGHKSS